MPLAALLAPQIAKKAAEIESAIGPAPTGYLAAPVPAPADEPDAPGAPDEPEAQSPGYLQQAGSPTALDPRGLLQDGQDNVAVAKPYDIRSPGGQIIHNAGVLQRSGQTVMANALLAGIGYSPHNPGYLARKDGSEMMIPTPPAPVVVAPQAPRPRHFIPLPEGTAGFNELGQAVDIKGKNLGYLPQPADDKLPRLPPEPKDWNQPALEATFGPHLREMQANVDENGMPTDQFPPGYFANMSKEKRDSIKAGVKELMKRAKGTKI